MSVYDSVLAASDVKIVAERYQKRIQEYGATFESLNSGSIKKQQIRHQVHASAIKKNSPSILDIGCGLGDFYKYLKDCGKKCHYTGYDIVPEYIKACRHSFADASFYERNIFEDGIDGVFDIIILSQVLNNKYKNSDNLTVMKTAMRLAFEHTRDYVSIDMMSSYVDYENPILYYYSPEDIFRDAKTITKRVILRHDYLDFEFCIQMFHSQVK